MPSQAHRDGRPGALLGVAIALLKSPGNWTPGRLAETARGDRIDLTDARAVRWGCMGALIRACSLRNVSADGRAFGAAMICLHQAAGLRRSGRSLLDWERDPGRSHRDVLTTLRHAAVLAHLRERTDTLEATKAPASRDGLPGASIAVPGSCDACRSGSPQ
jgi:hypothetical protein